MDIVNNPLHAEVNALFHKLWTKAVGTKDYNKEEWKKMEQLIFDLARR